jgi:hypothetical protein
VRQHSRIRFPKPLILERAAPKKTNAAAMMAWVFAAIGGSKLRVTGVVSSKRRWAKYTPGLGWSRGAPPTEKTVDAECPARAGLVWGLNPTNSLGPCVCSPKSTEGCAEGRRVRQDRGNFFVQDYPSQEASSDGQSAVRGQALVGEADLHRLHALFSALGAVWE